MRVLLYLMLALALPVSAHAEEAKKPVTESVAKEQPAWVMLIRLRHDLYARWKAEGKWPDDRAANAALSAHGAYWQEQNAAGKVLIGGGMDGDYWDNVAMIVFRAATREEAEAMVAADPAVKAYVFQAQVRPFTVSLKGKAE